MNKAITALLIAACIGTGGCVWMGKTAGRAQASVERGVEDLKTGYDEGYSTEKSRNGKNDASATAKSDTDAPAGQKAP